MTQNPNISWMHLQRMSLQDKLQLRDKLLACPFMSNRDSRDTIVNLLDPQIGKAIPRSPTDIVDVTNIVNTCYPGGLRELVEVVGAFEKNSDSMKALNAFLEEMPVAQAIEQTIGKAFFDELKQITQDIRVSKDNLERIYMQSVSAGWFLPDTQGSDETKTLALMLRELAQHAQKKHIVRFVNLLISYTPEQAARQSLHNWVERAKSKFTLTQADLAVFPVSGRSPSLLVKFKTDEDAPGLVSIEACFLGEREEYNKVLHVDEEPRSYETIPALFDQLLRASRQCVRERHHKLTIEVFFPAAFLNYDVDYWEITAGLSGKIAISKYYPLVVRSLERVISEDTIEGEIIRDHWRQSWSLFKQRVDPSFQPYYLRENISEQKDLAGRLLDIPCLALTFAPPVVSAGDNSHLFLKMIDAGIPIAFWPQCAIEQMDEQTIEQTYTSFWPTCDIPDLPRFIWEKRRKQTEPLLFRRLVLLWDDPDRLPKGWLLEREA